MAFLPLMVFVSNFVCTGNRQDRNYFLRHNPMKLIVACTFLAAALMRTAHAQSWTPFLDLLPGLTYSQPSTGAPIGPTAYIPSSTAIDLREQPYFSFIYTSGFQQNIDLQLRNAAGEALAESGPFTNTIRITLPRTAGYSRLWTVPLTNLLKPNLIDYHVATFSFLHLNPIPNRINIEALGFSTNFPSPEPRVFIAASNSTDSASTNSEASVTNQLFFYNGVLRYAPDLESNWTLVPAARNRLETNSSIGMGFFATAAFALPPPPPVNLYTNLPSGGGGGYINVRVPHGFQIVANQLVYSNTVSAGLFGNPNGTIPNHSAIIRLDEPYSFVPPGASEILASFLETFGPIDRARICMNLYEDGVWSDPNQSIAPGEGFIFYNPGEEFTALFVGSALTGILMNEVPAGLSIRAPLAVDAGGITSLHNLRPSIGDTVTRATASGLVTYTFTEPGVWDPSEPFLKTGEGVLINAQHAFTWTRVFNPNLN